MDFTVIPRSWAPMLQSVLRIMTGLLFLEHGTGKILGFPPLPHSGTLNGFVLFTGLMELIGGALITVGLFTRPVAFVLSGYMTVAYFMAHFPKSFFPILNSGEPAVFFCFIFFYIAAAGPGPWAIDRE
jgi:putative oxidoreductase